MSTDYQRAREALGVRLRTLRTGGGLTGRQLAERCHWPHSKVSKLENGRQTATPEVLDEWARGCGVPEEAEDLQRRLRGLEAHVQSRRRQLSAGHGPIQEQSVVEYRGTQTIRAYEATVIPGLFQTPDYARALLIHNAEIHQTPRDTEAAVRARMRRQQELYEPGKRHRIILWEGALHARPCAPETLAAQLDRLAGLIGLDRVSLGIIPLGAPMALTPKHGFWIFDERLVRVETISTELRLDDPADVALYGRTWDRLNNAAAYGPDAHRVLTRARRLLASA
ncbi:helix-turn-helix domain-containing protein [Streptomyces zagrosensis]|uniref:Transcriptional regulator with XRE-family HTH domain n=1 Tax=Streptomyces zagrosensis TaxID=1042984 RepID=A0A7W9V158_9ACTN|nr:helix-turn-helix transcriptional regulator [Streptomyces zagrosensis]MBB5937921.1 transcriptional regulator with XRE-family HTH domain [Streptomyces zagrosensis]